MYVVIQFFFGLKIFKLVLHLLSFVSDPLLSSETKENKNKTGFNFLKPKNKFEPQQIHLKVYVDMLKLLHSCHL